MKQDIQAAQARAADVEVERDMTIAQIGNLVHDSVPVSNDEVSRDVL